MYCTKCGHKIMEGAAFCPSCGTPVASKPSGQVQQAPPSAQASQVPQASPAPQVPQEPAAPQSQPGQVTSQPPAPKKKRGLIIGIVAGVVALAAIAIVVVLVVLPKTTSRGIWMATKVTFEQKNKTTGKTSANVTTKNIDKNGALVSETYEDSSPDSTYKSETKYTTNDQGFCESGSRKVTFGDSSDDETEYLDKYNWTFGNDGMPSELNVVEKDDDSTRCTYEYDDKGNIRKRSYSYKAFSAYSGTTEFDEQGNLTHAVTEDDGGKIHETTYEYKRDASGRLTGCTYTRTEKSTGKKALEGTSTFEYDENGNIVKEEIKESSYDLEDNGKRTDTEATYEYEYTYVDNPLPWVAKLAHLYTISSPMAY